MMGYKVVLRLKKPQLGSEQAKGHLALSIQAHVFVTSVTVSLAKEKLIVKWKNT